MIVIIGLLILLAVGDAFVIVGQSATGLPTGQLFLYAIVVGVIGMLGLAMLLGTFKRRLASRGSRRALIGIPKRECPLRLDRERLTQQLDDERTEHSRRHAVRYRRLTRRSRRPVHSAEPGARGAFRDLAPHRQPERTDALPDGPRRRSRALGRHMRPPGSHPRGEESTSCLLMTNGVGVPPWW